jgi:cation diffusion facilitator family transporter
MAKGDRRHRHQVKSARVAATLLAGPGTLAEITDRYYAYLKALGFFRMGERLVQKRMKAVTGHLEATVNRGWVALAGAHYALTPLGRKEVEARLSELGETGALLRKSLHPQAVSKVTLGVHLGLAALKLPAGILSGSVALINDAADTLLDALSSIVVYAGIRFNRERGANVTLVLLMLATGGFTLYEALQRFFIPAELTIDWFAFLAAILSAPICMMLWAYQRFVGLRSGVMALITQSVDSRNHVIISGGVIAGLVAAYLEFPLLDTVVGLAIALLILKSALELAVETIRSFGEEVVDLSRFEFGIAAQYEQFRGVQLNDWMLYQVEKQGIDSRSELIDLARQAIDFNNIAAARAIGLSQQPTRDNERIERSFSELIENGWMTGEGRLAVTNSGKQRLNQWA